MDVGLKNRQNIKLFAQMINCLAKVGEEVTFDVKVDRVSFITINSSKSTYARFTLLHSFFDKFAVLANAPKIIRMALKTVVHVFKNANHLDQLKIVVDKNTNKVIFDSFGLSQVQKIYQINYFPCDVVNPEHNLQKDFEFVVISSFLGNLMNPFGKLTGDITFLLGKRIVVPVDKPPTPSSGNRLSQGGQNLQVDLQQTFTQYYIQLKSFTEKGEKQSVHTSLAVDTITLESFVVHNPTDTDANNPQALPRPTPPIASEQGIHRESEMTFSFKDLKSLVNFCESAEYNLQFYMTKSRGDPIIVKSESPGKEVEVEFLMATVDNEDSDMQMTDTTTVTTPARRPSQSHENQMSDDPSFSTPNSNASQKRKRAETIRSNDDSSFLNDSRINFGVTGASVPSNNSGKSIYNQFLNEDMPYNNIQCSFGLNGENERYIRLEVPQSDECLSSGEPYASNPKEDEGMVAQRHVLSAASEGDEDEEEEVPGTPTQSPKRRK